MDTDATRLSILVIYAHIADSAAEAAGTVARHADRGDRVTSVICSNGERHHPDLFLDPEEAPGRRRDSALQQATMTDIKALKRQEAERVAEILGVSELIFLGWDDDYVEITEDRIRQLADVILAVRPDIVLTHLPKSPIAYTDPHALIGQMAVRAVAVAATRIRQIDGVAAHHVKEIFYFPMGGEIADSHNLLSDGIVCDVWIDITPVIGRKVQAMDQIVSQGYHGPTARKIVEAREGRWGMLANVSYAEPFLRSRGRTYDALPLPDSVLHQEIVPNNLPGDLIIAHDVPLATGGGNGMRDSEAATAQSNQR